MVDFLDVFAPRHRQFRVMFPFDEGAVLCIDAAGSKFFATVRKNL